MAGMIPIVHWITRHLSTDLVKGTALSIVFGNDLSIAIVQSLDLPKDMRRDRNTSLFVNPFDMMHIMEGVNETAILLRNF